MTGYLLAEASNMICFNGSLNYRKWGGGELKLNILTPFLTSKSSHFIRKSPQHLQTDVKTISSCHYIVINSFSHLHHMKTWLTNFCWRNCFLHPTCLPRSLTLINDSFCSEYPKSYVGRGAEVQAWLWIISKILVSLICIESLVREEKQNHPEKPNVPSVRV